MKVTRGLRNRGSGDVPSSLLPGPIHASVTSARGVSAITGADVFRYGPFGSDTTPPAINVPGTITANATSPRGAVVTYSVSASDPDDTVASLRCTPASGSTFTIGTTTVTCTATDTHENMSTASFAVHLKSAAQQLADLLTAVTGVGPGTTSLTR